MEKKMTADEMLKEIGYEFKEVKDAYLYENNNAITKNQIVIKKDRATIGKYTTYIASEKVSSRNLSSYEVVCIAKKIEELGWYK